MISRSRILAFVVCLALTAALTPSFGATYSYSTLYDFDGTNGYNPDYVAIDPAGNLFGTYGTPSGQKIFEIAAGTHNFSTAASLPDYGIGGPTIGFISDSSGNLYGAAGYSGSQAVIYRIAANTHVVTPLAFYDAKMGIAEGLAIDSSGNLYGTTVDGGANGKGSVFELAAGAHTISIIASFNGTNGKSPSGQIAIDSFGNIYGSTAFGGVDSAGTVFKVAAGTHALTALADISLTGNDVPYDKGGVVLGDDGNIYSITISAGFDPGFGKLFKVSPTTGKLTVLATLDNSSGIYAFSAPLIDSSGNFLGLTADGGALGQGTIYQFDPITHSLGAIHYIGPESGRGTYSNLVMDARGNIYGTISTGGAYNMGTIFKLSVVPEASSVLLSFGAVAVFAGGCVHRRLCRASGS